MCVASEDIGLEMIIIQHYVVINPKDRLVPGKANAGWVLTDRVNVELGISLSVVGSGKVVYARPSSPRWLHRATHTRHQKVHSYIINVTSV